MSNVRLLLATLCLNELEWLPKLWEQHKDWPGLLRWVFVEAADAAYMGANPGMATAQGLSADGTTEFLERLAREDDRVVHVPFGRSRHQHLSQGKAPARSAYLELADAVQPTHVLQLDADEFYCLNDQQRVNDCLSASPNLGMCFRQREIWRPASCAADPLFSWEVVGGLWKMHHCHGWRWVKGMRHVASHVWPQLPCGRMMNTSMTRWDMMAGTPEYIHLGWASSAANRDAKTRYYEARGEGLGDGRRRWMQCRRAARGWKPGDLLPHGARVIEYAGPVPEVFR